MKAKRGGGTKEEETGEWRQRQAKNNRIDKDAKVSDGKHGKKYKAAQTNQLTAEGESTQEDALGG